jgi:uncharacterized phiE125 gp8 family phage protein
MGMSPGYGDKILTPPSWEPVSLAEAKSQCRVVDTSVDDNDISFYITAAREFVETVTRRAIPQQQWELTMDEFPGRQVDDYRPPTWRYGIIRVPRPPLISVDLVQYVDPGQSTQPFTYTTLSSITDYQVDANTEPGRIAPAPFTVWPPTNPLAMQAVKVHFTAGWASANLVPARLKQGIRLLVGHLYENREAAIEVALKMIPAGLMAFITSAAHWEYC